MLPLNPPVYDRVIVPELGAQTWLGLTEAVAGATIPLGVTWIQLCAAAQAPSVTVTAITSVVFAGVPGQQQLKTILVDPGL